MQATWPCENVLLALLCERPMHGYELYQCVAQDAALSAIWRIQRSELYFLLRKLENAGLVKKETCRGSGGPPRQIYIPTPAGRAELALWLDSAEHYPHDVRTAFLAKLYLAWRREPQAAFGLIERQRETLKEWAVRQKTRAEGKGFAAIVSRLRLAQIEATLTCLDELQEQINAPDLSADAG